MSEHVEVQDKATLRSLGYAILAMCAGALCLMAIAITLGN